MTLIFLTDLTVTDKKLLHQAVPVTWLLSKLLVRARLELTLLHEFHMMEPKNAEISAKEIIAVQHATFTAGKRKS